MNAEFPVEVEAVYVGKSGDSGDFVDKETGEKVSYAEAHAFHFDSAGGNVQTIVMRANRIDEVCQGFDVSKLQRYKSRVRIIGNAVIGERRSFFKPLQITPAN